MNRNTTTTSAQIQAVIGTAQPSAHLLHVLFALQHALQHIPHEAVHAVARQLHLPVSQVQAVVEFYSFFHQAPRGEYQILFSNCPCCGHQAGGGNLLPRLRELLQVTADETRSDGRLSLTETSCIGMCDHGPSMLVNGVPLCGLDAEKIQRLAALVEARQPLSVWPADWFTAHDHVQLAGLLLQQQAPNGAGLRASLALGAEATLQAIDSSGLRGRGGAGFSTGKKWQLCRDTPADARFVVCNADEGEPGTFKDRVLLHSHADAVFEGMTLCGHAIGACQGFLYLRGEYRYLLPHLQSVLAQRRQQGLLGHSILGHADFNFDIEIVVGAGAYICGEESALIESLEGRRGIPRIRPPFPVTHGYLGQPTVVNNVETFFAAAHIALRGSEWFSSAGTEKSTGSKLLSISGDCDRPGIYEYPFGISLQQILDDCGAREVQAVQLGGPAGALLDPQQFGHILGYEDLSTGGALMIFSRRRDLLSVIQNFAHFFAHESCGFCTPCRVGSTLLKNGMDKIARGSGTQYDVDDMKRIAAVARHSSHCGLGRTIANPVLDGLQRFPQLFQQRLLRRNFEPQFNLDAALEQARQISHRDDAAAHLDNSFPSLAGGRRAGDHEAAEAGLLASPRVSKQP